MARTLSLRRASIRVELEALEDRVVPAPVTFSVTGKMLWTDSAGGTHGVPLAVVELREQDAGGSTVIATSTTDHQGNIRFTNVTFDDGEGEGGPDVFVRVFARSSVADIKPTGAAAATYFVDSTVANNLAANATSVHNITAGNVTDTHTSFSIHHALVVIGAYTGNLAGSTPSQIDTRYDASVTGSFFRSSPKQLFIRGTAKFEWDVIHHEYGHYVMNVHGFQNNPGGAHSSNDNLAQTRGSKDIGLRLAWGEGWPTFFGTAGQQSMGTAALGIPQVGDLSYTSFGGSLTYNLETSTGKGEDNELSVQTALWDVFDAARDGVDDFNLSDKTIFQRLKAAGVKTVGAAWEALAGPLSTQDRTRLGGVFGMAKIAPVLTAPADNFTAGASPPTFKWDKNGGGTPNPLNDFVIKFYKADFSSVIFEKNVGDVAQYTPTAAEWNTIKAGDSIIKWVVEGKNTSNPASPGGAIGRYWSGARTIGGVKIAFVIDDTGSMGEEIAGVRNALQRFIDTLVARLRPGQEPPMIQLITFKDDTTVRITSKDMAAVRAAVGSLVASGGGDCPEFSAQALALAAENISAGGTILLATDASSQPGVDIASVIAKLRAKGVTVNTILSGDCGPIGSASPVVVESHGHSPGEEGTCNGATADCGCSRSASSAISPVSSFLTYEANPSSGGVLREPTLGGGDDDDGPQDPIDDPGQPAIDDHGDTTEAATPLLLGMPRILGTVGAVGDAADFFTFNVTKVGKRHGLDVQLIDGGELGVTVLKPDGTTQVLSTFVFGTQTLGFNPDMAGAYFIKVDTAGGSGARSYHLSVSENPLAGLTSAVDLFSTVSALTGGTFLVRDGINAGNVAGFEAAIFNIMASSLGAAVLSANPDVAPAGQTLAISLVGANTNWRQGATTVSFSDARIRVQSVQVTSARTLTVVVAIDAATPQAFYDVTTRTPLGGATEVATGVSVVQVGPTTNAPTLLSVEPGNLGQGVTSKVIIRGANVNWTNTAVVTLGPGITVRNVKANSPTQLEADVDVDPGADIGFRTARVTQDGQTVEVDRAVFVGVTGVGLPEITGLDVNTVRAGELRWLRVAGANTQFIAGVTTADFGDGVTVRQVNVLSPTQADVLIQVDANAAAGFRNVIVVTGGETAVLLAGLFVDGGGGGGGGVVTARVVGGALLLRGDTGNNRIVVQQLGVSLFQVIGVGGTLINGQGSLTITNATHIGTVVMGAGNDSIEFRGIGRRLEVMNSLIDMGAGNDNIALSNVRFRGTNRIVTGAGRDSLRAVDAIFSRGTSRVVGREDLVSMFLTSIVN